MPLRRNRRQYEQLTDFDREPYNRPQRSSGSQKVECTVAEGQDVPGTQMIAEDRAIRRVATSAPTTSLASIQRHLPPSRHPVPSRETIRRRLTEVGLRSRRPLRRLPLTPHHRQCRLDFADLGQLGV
ncbi:hypothetical protein TNCV_3530381 [Trichonephila clavipes]|nr:hypothetical protein TNCV_3530381 [Trichonephila clavipes]